MLSSDKNDRKLSMFYICSFRPKADCRCSYRTTTQPLRRCRGHPGCDKLDHLSSHRRIKIAQRHDHVAKLRIDSQLATHSGGTSGMTVVPKGTFSWGKETITVGCFLNSGRFGKHRLGNQLP